MTHSIFNQQNFIHTTLEIHDSHIEIDVHCIASTCTASFDYKKTITSSIPNNLTLENVMSYTDHSKVSLLQSLQAILHTISLYIAHQRVYNPVITRLNHSKCHVSLI